MKLEKKQKVLLVVTVIVIAVLVWQFYGLFWGDVSSSSPAPKPKSVQSTTQQTPVNKSSASSVQKNSNTGDMKVESNLPPAAQEKKAQLPTEQTAYLNIVNQYELAKMENQLLTQQASIAETKNRIAKLNQETMQLGGNVVLTAPNNNSSASGFQLAYLGQQDGQWIAALRNQDQYQTVSVNQQLADNSVVMSIDHQGVLLKQQDGQEVRITFQGAFVVNPPMKVASASTIAAPALSKKTNVKTESLEDLVKVAQEITQTANGNSHA